MIAPVACSSLNLRPISTAMRRRITLTPMDARLPQKSSRLIDERSPSVMSEPAALAPREPKTSDQLFDLNLIVSDVAKYSISTDGLLSAYERPFTVTSAQKKTLSDGAMNTYERTVINMSGKRRSVLASPSRRMTKDVPTSEKKSETELVACPKKPMNRANAAVSAYSGCAFAITFISKSSTVTTTSKRHVMKKMPATYGCLPSRYTPSTRPGAPLSLPGIAAALGVPVPYSATNLRISTHTIPTTSPPNAYRFATPSDDDMTASVGPRIAPICAPAMMRP
mmetsp:Transcript_1462/g.4813  ORF Transcript_1462/g.4813 Transcript_1462/m.4813 type:complete len:281 (+) Transcript_1462:317-1159(+)